jgi:exonuclease III
MAIRIATFNLENLDDTPGADPSLAARIAIMQPQLQRVRADILCLQEINSQGPSTARLLTALDALLAGTPYANFQRATTTMTSGGLYDVRNLVTLSRFPITSATSIRSTSGARPSYQMATANPPDAKANPVDWERPLLYSQHSLPNGQALHVINVHMKSKLASTIPGQKLDTYTWRTISAWAEGSFISAMKRLGQALQARVLIDEIFDDHSEAALIAICGDFNASSEEVSLKAICGDVAETGNAAHATRILVPCENNIPDSARYSLLHLGHGSMLDHIIASRALLQYFRHAEIHNEALPDESGAFRTDSKFPESDHAPVIAEFELGA